MAGDNSTTEPPMLGNTGRDILYNHIFFVRIFPLCAHFSLLFSDNNLRIFRAQIISCVGRNRTGVYRMAGDNSNTEPPMLEITGGDILNNHTFFLRAHFPLRARFSLRAHFSLPFSDNNLRIFRAQIISCIGRESNSGLSRGRRQF